MSVSCGFLSVIPLGLEPNIEILSVYRCFGIKAYYGRTGFVFSSFLCCFLSNHLVCCNILVIFAHNTPINNRFLLKMKEYTHYNRIKSVLAEKNKTGTWLSEQMGRNLGTVSRWMTNKVQPSIEQLYEIAKHLDVDVRELLAASK